MDYTLIISGLLVPPIVSFLKNVKWDRRVKVLASIVVSFLVTSVTLFLQDEFTNWGDYVESAGTTWAIAQAWYQLHFGDTSVNVVLEDALYTKEGEI